MLVYLGSVGTLCFFKTEAKVELLTDPDMHLFVESSIRGGVATISSRHALSNNSYLPPEHYDPSEERSYVIYADANNLYGLALSRPLPISDFKFLSDEEIEQLDIMNVPRDCDTGFISEVDLEYPEYLHQEHNSMPLAPENIVITRGMLLESTIEMSEKFDSKFLPQKKLCPNLMDKTKTSFISSISNFTSIMAWFSAKSIESCCSRNHSGSKPT